MVYISDEQIGCMTDYWVTMASADFRDVLRTIDVPTAIIYADPGSGYQPATAEYIHSQIPDSILCPATECSHLLPNRQNQEGRAMDNAPRGFGRGFAWMCKEIMQPAGGTNPAQ